MKKIMKRQHLKLSKLFFVPMFCLGMLLPVTSCTKDVDNSPESLSTEINLLPLSKTQIDVINNTPRNIIIAHRGSTFWAPEETEAAMRWARNAGADYLEVDLQLTKDNVLIALHDDNLSRTTDIALKFPGKEDLTANNFTYKELLTLDAGSWFNNDPATAAQARASFVGLDILTFEDVIMIAEGYRIKRDEEDGKRITTEDAAGKITSYYEIDPEDNGNRPGVYPETKEPWQFPNIEQILKDELVRLGWYADNISDMKNIPVTAGLVGIANTPSRIIVQTFSRPSLINLNKIFTRKIPTCFLLWLDKGNASGGSMSNDDPISYGAWINFGIEHGATIMGPSISGKPNNYANLLEPWMGDLIHRSGMNVHGYSFDTDAQMREYSGVWYNSELGIGRNLVDGWFTNKADMSVSFFANDLQTLFDAGENHFQSNALMTNPKMPNNIQEFKYDKEPVPGYFNSREALTKLGYYITK